MTLMDAAMGYLNEAISIANGATFTLPAAWIINDLTSDEFVKLVHSYKARYMSGVARTKAEPT